MGAVRRGGGGGRHAAGWDASGAEGGVSTVDALVFLAVVRDALATPEGARIAQEIRALVMRADEPEADGDTYAARVVARAYARVERRRPKPLKPK